MKSSIISRPWIRFAWAACSHAIRGRFSYPQGHLPRAGHTVDPAFAGVGVATADNPAVDAYILDRLHEANIRNVRLDFTYGDDAGPAGRLLDALHARGIDVVLHLVQPFAQAKRMETDAACQEEWRSFIARTLGRHGSRCQMIEIGSTINRKNWAGYSLAGFLVMWDIAWQEIRKRGLLLAGPSITDFEPPWNVGVLALLQARGQLPDVQTDNLFSERCIEPERHDHKILGHALAPLAGFNLIKKARMLQRIGHDFSVPRLFSPSAFWTLPRIERRVPASEEKQADYLSRYMLLCAASGALERAWWGPLICHREGLVDDQVAQYPRLERITHYASVSPTVEEFRIRPAMGALATFARFIPGAVYEGRLSDSPAIEVHAFRSGADLVHAVWTHDGQLAVLADIYSPDDLLSARCLSRNGEDLAEKPSFAGESPLYLVWSTDRIIRIKPGIHILNEVSVDWHASGKKHFHFREDGWQGVVLAENHDDFACLLKAIDPRQLPRPQPEQILRKARNVIWAIDDPRTTGKKLVIKQPLKMYLHKRLLDRFKPSKGVRSWTGTAELLRRGIGAAAPVAYFERTDASKLTENFYICEFSKAVCSVRDLFSKYAKGESCYRGIRDEIAYDQLSSYLLKMHRCGIVFRDLSGGNILITSAADNELRFELIDTGRLHVYPQAVSFRKRTSDLVRVCNKLHWQGRKRFLKMYFGKCGREFHWAHQLPFMIYDLKVILKRKLKNLY